MSNTYRRAAAEAQTANNWARTARNSKVIAAMARTATTCQPASTHAPSNDDSSARPDSPPGKPPNQR